MSGAAADSGPGDAVARFEGVTQRFGDAVALDALDLALPAGCTVGILGPDGVGKSTLLACLAGVRRPAQGRVTVLGGDVARPGHRRRLRPRVAYMPQGLGRNLYPDLSVWENVAFFARLFGLGRAARRRRIDELLEATGLAAFPDRHVRKLSGGMKQKLGLCCALVHDPDLLVLDEPTTGVDPLSRRQFWELVARMRERRPGMAVVVATAVMEEAERFDHLVLMDAGRVLAEGAPAALRERAGAESLSEAFVALLPEERRRGHRPFEVPPLAADRRELAIEARELTRRFGDFTAVDRVSFEIRRGEIFGFVGPNGCGKTTTMKMLTGILPPSEGTPLLFGRPADPRDRSLRRQLGYMSQGFSLYTELTVRQNLELHGRLYGLPGSGTEERIRTLLPRFGLEGVVDTRAADLPLGLRQRLSLAVAVIHEPEILILDEPTSGVDPVARDGFWNLLGELSRERGVTIFVSTHYLEEGARCDRLALMNAGRVLATEAPEALVAERDAASLEDAFVQLIREDRERARDAGEPRPVRAGASRAEGRPGAAEGGSASSGKRARREGFSPGRLLAVTTREALELTRDPIRLLVGVAAPLLLLLVLGFGINLDVEDLPFLVLDRDRSPESRTVIEAFEGSRYFLSRGAAASDQEIDRALRAGRVRLALEIPPRFGEDLRAGHAPELGLWIDGAMPFRGETTRGYALGIEARLAERFAGEGSGAPGAAPYELRTRFRYNQELESAHAIVPGVLALVMILFPTMLMSVAVVREKELGSIANFQATPLTRSEFLVGKQLPYVALSAVAFAIGVTAVVTVFGVPLRGSPGALALGGLIYVYAATGLGLLISAFTRTQIAAVVAAAILTIMPTFEFSGILTPVSSLTGGAAVMGRALPGAYFNAISVGAFTKSLGFAELWARHVALVGFGVLFTTVAALLLRKQEHRR